MLYLILMKGLEEVDNFWIKMTLKKKVVLFVFMLAISLLVRFIFIRLFDLIIPIEAMVVVAVMVTLITKPEKKRTINNN